MSLRIFLLFFLHCLFLIDLFGQANSSCECWQQRDITFNIVKFNGSGASGGPGTAPEYRNDDWSTNQVAIPFNFCFYGTNYNKVFINNNGNISFGSAYSTFTANPFPDPDFSMVAPFWGDVDTRSPGSGLVYFKITPVSLIIQWDSVGYYNTYSDKVNTFQLIISNGTDPVIPNGNNVSFCYKDMQWTTGDASLSPPCPGGGNGFGGCPATVGANKGDGINYIQFARFDKPGNIFDGPFGNADGIDWLDDQQIYFNTCATANIAPVVTDFNICEMDTLTVCEKETLTLSIAFQAPEFGQTTYPNAISPNFDGFSILNNNFGNTANITIEVIGNEFNLGYNTITISATDDGTPVQTTTFDIVILVEAAPEILVSPEDTAFCVPEPFLLSATGADSYTWSPAASLSSTSGPNVTATPQNDITYTVIGLGPSGCKDTSYSTVTFGSLQTDIFPESSIICEGDSVQLTAIGGTSHTWSPAAGLSTSTGPTVIAAPTITSTYLLTSDSSTCSGTDSISIIVIPMPDIIVSPLNPEICSGDSVILIASGTNTYQWSPSAGLNSSTKDTVSANPFATTTFYVSGNLNGCNGMDSITVIVNPLPSVNILPDDPVICENETQLLTASGALTYNWFPFENLSDTFGANVSVFPEDTFTYYVIGFDFKGCADTDTVVVAVKFNALADAGVDLGFCSGDSGILGSSAFPGCTYSWWPSIDLGTLDSSFTSVSIDNFSNTPLVQTYFLTALYNNCPDTDTVVVTVYPLPIIDISPANPEICIGDSARLIATGATTYVWSPTLGLNSGSNDTVFANPSSTSTFSALGNQMGCIGTKSVTLIVNPLPTVGILPMDPVICENESVDLSASGALAYLWTPSKGVNDTLAQNVTVSPSDTSTYHVTGVDLNGCAGSDSVTIIVKFNTLANAGPDIGYCAGDSGIIGSAPIPGCKYSWFPAIDLREVDSSSTIVSIVNFSIDITTKTYILTVMNDGCPDQDIVEVSVFPDPQAICDISPAITGISAPVNFTSNSINGTQCLWNFGNGDSLPGCSALYSYSSEGTYQVALKVSSPNGCISDTTCLIEITKLSYYIPNSFTPDGDGVNDYFSIIGRNILNFKMLVFNRWGDLIFESSDTEIRWDGMVKNKKAKPDVYVYKMEFSDITGKIYKPIGRVTLLR